MSPEKDQKMVKLSVYLTPEQRAKFKAVCALREQSMNEVLAEKIDELISDFDGKKNRDLPVPNTSK